MSAAKDTVFGYPRRVWEAAVEAREQDTGGEGKVLTPRMVTRKVPVPKREAIVSESREPTDAEIEAVAYALLDTVWKDRGAWAAAIRGDRLLVKVDGELDFRKLARAAITAMRAQ